MGKISKIGGKANNKVRLNRLKYGLRVMNLSLIIRIWTRNGNGLTPLCNLWNKFELSGSNGVIRLKLAKTLCHGACQKGYAMLNKGRNRNG